MEIKKIYLDNIYEYLEIYGIDYKQKGLLKLDYKK